ncbi:MAG: hypothetical protein ABI623_05580 [bacterium]
MNPSFRILAAVLALHCSACAPIPPAEFPRPADVGQGMKAVVARVVADGMIHRQFVGNDGPWNVHVLAIDLGKRDLDIMSARALDSLKGRETTSSIARRASPANREVLGAMNADFFNMQTGENDLNQIIEGEIVKGVKKPLRAQFALGYSRMPYIEKFEFEGTAITSDARFGIDAVNSLKDSTMVVLNRFFGVYARKENESVLVLHTARRNGRMGFVEDGRTIHCQRLNAIVARSRPQSNATETDCHWRHSSTRAWFSSAQRTSQNTCWRVAADCY